MSEQIKPTTIPAKSAAAYLGISYWKLLEMIKAKQIPHIKVGKRYLFRVEALDRWMANQEVLNSQSLEKNKKSYGKLRRIEG